jgi:hypothetical protein
MNQPRDRSLSAPFYDQPHQFAEIAVGMGIAGAARNHNDRRSLFELLGQLANH